MNLSEKLAPETISWGCTVTPAQVGPGQLYFKLIHAEGPYEWGGRISVFIEVLDMAGQRMVGVPVLWSNGEPVKKVTEAKPNDPFAVDIPMYAKGNAYSVRIANGDIPSDAIHGFGLPDHAPHHVFRVVFQLAVAGGLSEPPGPLPPVEPPAMSTAEAIRTAKQLLDYALGRLQA